MGTQGSPPPLTVCSTTMGMSGGARTGTVPCRQRRAPAQARRRERWGGKGESPRPSRNQDPPPETPQNRESPEIDTLQTATPQHRDSPWDRPVPRKRRNPPPNRDPGDTPGTRRGYPPPPSPPPPAPSRSGSARGARDPRKGDIASRRPRPPRPRPLWHTTPPWAGPRHHRAHLGTTLPIMLRGAAAMTPPEPELEAPRRTCGPPGADTAPRWTRHGPIEQL